MTASGDMWLCHKVLLSAYVKCGCAGSGAASGEARASSTHPGWSCTRSSWELRQPGSLALCLDLYLPHAPKPNKLNDVDERPKIPEIRPFTIPQSQCLQIVSNTCRPAISDLQPWRRVTTEHFQVSRAGLSILSGHLKLTRTHHRSLQVCTCPG